MPSRNTTRSVDVNSLVPALVAIINLVHPVYLALRIFPPTLNHHQGGLHANSNTTYLVGVSD
jgi:hypothetical protein